MFLSDISIKRPIMASMGLLVFLLFGILSFFAINLNLMPSLEFGYVTVQTVYPGGDPRTIETQITQKIEDAAATVSGIDFMRSYSMDKVSIVILKFLMGKDADVANQEVKDKIDAILNELPDDAEIPIVQKFDINAQPIMDIILSGNIGQRELYEIADKRLKDRLSQVEGVAKVDIIGGEEREIRVELDNRVVFQHSISLPQVAQILAAHNMDLPGGNFQQRSQDYSVRFKGEFTDLETLKQVEIPTASGPKKLFRLADVRDTGADVRERTVYFDNRQKIRNNQVVLLRIIKSADGNTVDMAEGILAALPGIEGELPPGCTLTVVRDKSAFIKSSVEDTLMNILLGVILTGLILLFFLHDLRSTIIVAVAMPFSILSTFLLMRVSGFTLNIMTLMGLSTAVGILVTNSVVVLENIFRHKEMGHDRRQAAGKGTAEIAVAVVASTMTNIVVFLPIATMSSMVGQFFKEFALTVTFATLFSLLVSFTLTPMLSSLILPEKDTKRRRIGRRLESMFDAWEGFYRKMLGIVLASKWRSGLVVLASLALFILSFSVASRVGFEFMPTLDEGDIGIEVELPQGYRLEETARLLQEIETRIQSYPEVKHMVTTLGSISDMDKGTNVAKMDVKLVDAERRELTSNQAANLFIRDLADIPNSRLRIAAASPVGGGEAPIQFFLLGQDVDRLEKYKNEVIRRIKDIEGLINLNTSSRPGKPEITLVPDREKISRAGLTVFDLAFSLRSAVEGVVATRFKEGGNEYDIRVMLKDESVDTPEEVENIAVVSPGGTYRLSHFADIRFTESYSKILHENKYKSIEFSGHTVPGVPLGDVVTRIRENITDLQMPGGYKVDWGGEAQLMEETAADMMFTFIIAILLTYMLLAAILESLSQPLMILGTVPLALIGVFLALFITGKTMNTISMMAIIMLLGIVVNNAILMLDYTNILRKQGKSLREALVEACPTKLKPILMATTAIILGMLPLAVGIGESGVEFRQPMGIVSIGGLVVSTVFTLMVIPALMVLSARKKRVGEKSEA